MNRLLVLFLALFLSGCVEKKIKKDFDNNIKELNNFYHSAKQDMNEPLVVPSLNIEEHVECSKASIRANKITPKALIKLLSKLYNTNINYASDINVGDIPTDTKPTDDSQNSHNGQKELEKVSALDRISLDMADVCINDVLDTLTENYNIGVEKTRYGYVIHPKQLKTETFRVDYHNFYRKGKSSISIVNSQLQEQQDKERDGYSSISTESLETFWASVTKTIRTILSADKGRKLLGSQGDGDQSLEDFYVYKESGLIVVTAYPRQLKYIRKFLSQINGSSTKQVLIEAKILEVELNEEFSNGIQWDLLKKVLYFSPFAMRGDAIPDIADLSNKQNLSTTDGDMLSSVLSLKPEIPDINVRGINLKDNFSIVMQALASQGKISVISSSRIVALNNQRALIKSGEDKYFVTNVTNVTLGANGNNNNNGGSRSGFDLKPFFSGIALDTTPHIVNNKEVLLHIHPMISRVSDETKQIKIADQQTEIPIATVQSREADTVAKAHSGDIIILGGMTQNFVKLSETSLPVKGKSFLSKALRSLSAKKQHKSSKVELIILLKPTIINQSFSDRDDIGTYHLEEDL